VTHQDPIAEYLARGGRITRCPTAYAAPSQAARDELRGTFAGRGPVESQRTQASRERGANNGRANNARPVRWNRPVRVNRETRVDLIVDLICQGLTQRQVGARIGRAPKVVARILRDDLTPEQQARVAEATAPAGQSEGERQIAAMLADGVPPRQVAEALGVDRRIVRRVRDAMMREARNEQRQQSHTGRVARPGP
jgi:DNA-binding CsgD family transcriptional regulator